MSADGSFTILDDGRPVTVAARVTGERVVVAPDGLGALGWELHPEGLCREGLCVPVPDGVALGGPEGVDLAAFARVVDRPLALDTAEGVAYLGVSAAERGRVLAGLQAPDFTLPDLAGRLHSLSAQRGRKVLLVAYASW